MLISHGPRTQHVAPPDQTPPSPTAPLTARKIRNHINAKRWLVTTREGYYEKLSDASKETFTYQGGKMEGEERTAFETSEQFASHIRMRQWDEAAKDDSERMAQKVKESYSVEHWQSVAMSLLK